jgi:1-acyl-sn-glycerol-3-phosphate acyltransferase
MFRVSLRVAGLILLFLACLPLHLISKWISGNSPWPRRFLAAVGWIIGTRVKPVGEPIRPHSLLVANHTSWLDIIVLAGATGCTFVSKDDLGHGFIHWLADQNHTIYVRRSDRKGAKDQARAIAGALERTQPVALFPEGTTGPGDRLLPFRSTLLEAATFVSKEVAVRPVAIDYGPAAREVGWFEEGGKDNVLRILGRKSTLAVTVRLLDPLDPSLDRKAMARAAHDAIAAALAPSGIAPAAL